MRSLASPEKYDDLLARIARLKPDTQPLWGVMNAHGMLCHLSDSFLACMGERAISPDSSALRRTLIKWIAIYSPLPWPKNVPTRPEVQQGFGGSQPADFETDRQTVLRLLQRILSQPRDFAWCGHPIFGQLTEAEWLRWCYLHVDHHLRQFGL